MTIDTARGQCRRTARGPEVESSSSLSIHRSFVVRIYPDPGFVDGRICGLVEHVVSGRASEFQSLDDLLRFIRDVLITQQLERS